MSAPVALRRCCTRTPPSSGSADTTTCSARCTRPGRSGSRRCAQGGSHASTIARAAHAWVAPGAERVARGVVLACPPPPRPAPRRPLALPADQQGRGQAAPGRCQEAAHGGWREHGSSWVSVDAAAWATNRACMLVPACLWLYNCGVHPPVLTPALGPLVVLPLPSCPSPHLVTPVPPSRVADVVLAVVHADPSCVLPVLIRRPAAEVGDEGGGGAQAAGTTVKDDADTLARLERNLANTQVCIAVCACVCRSCGCARKAGGVPSLRPAAPTHAGAPLHPPALCTHTDFILCCPSFLPRPRPLSPAPAPPLQTHHSNSRLPPPPPRLSGPHGQLPDQAGCGRGAGKGCTQARRGAGRAAQVAPAQVRPEAAAEPRVPGQQRQAGQR